MRARLIVGYRRWVRWYPHSWRLANEQAMLGVLLDLAEEEGRNRLTAGEKLGMAAQGVGARIGAVVPQRVRDGVSTAALAAGAAFGLIMMGFHEVLPRVGPHLGWTSAAPLPQAPQQLSPGVLVAFGPFETPLAVIAGFWLAAAVCAVLGWRAAARVGVGAAALTALVLLGALRLAGIGWWGLNSTTLILVLVLAAAFFAGRPARGGRLIVTAAAWTLGLGALYAYCVYEFRLAFQSERERFFVQTVIGDGDDLALLIDLALLAALVLHLSRRPLAAGVVIGATLPWAAMWALKSVVGLVLGELTPQLFELLMLAGYAVVLGTVLVRIRNTGKRAAIAE